MIVMSHFEKPKSFDSLWKRSFQLFCSPFEISILCNDTDKACAALDAAGAEIRRIDKLLSHSYELNEINTINAAAGTHRVKVGSEVYNIIARASQISALTRGAFDLSFDSLDKTLLDFSDKKDSFQDDILSARAVRLINYKNIFLNNREGSVYLQRKGMRIGFGRICKGYAADKTRELLQSLGIESGMINVSGNLLTWGDGPNETPWTLASADPTQDKLPFSNLPLKDMAINTLCNQKSRSVKYPNECLVRIDPRTGFAVKGILTVSIICPSAELAETMSISVMIMGIKEGLRLINQLKAIACIIIDEEGIVHYSQNINILNC